MNSLQIRYFLKVANCLSFSRAAAELYVSQPSVSRQVKLLEEELGYALFDRTEKKRVRLTSAGMIFRESFQTAVQGLEQAKAAAGEAAARSPLRLRLGVGAGWDISEKLVRFRSRVCREYPQAEMIFECSPFLTLREKLQRGELDAILCTKTSILDFDGLEVVQVANLESRAYVRRGVLRPEDEPLRIEDFNEKSLLMLHESESPMAMELVQIQFQAMQVKVNPVWLPNRDTILQAVLMGDGFTVFDQYMYFRDDPRLTFYRLEDVIPICVLWKKEKKHPLIQLLIEEFAAHFGDHGASRV